ncbi:IclR family transcriptional regulator, partial [Rhodococcus sp. NPDC019616]
MARVHTGESALARAVRIVESFGLDDSTLTVS